MSIDRIVKPRKYTCELCGANRIQKTPGRPRRYCPDKCAGEAKAIKQKESR